MATASPLLYASSVFCVSASITWRSCGSGEFVCWARVGKATPNANPTSASIMPTFIPFDTETFLDLGVSSSEHGWVSHMTQDLVVTEALRKCGESIRVADFRAMMRTIGSRVKQPGNVPILLWNALYDGQGNRLTEPETVIVLLRSAIGPGVQ